MTQWTPPKGPDIWTDPLCKWRMQKTRSKKRCGSCTNPSVTHRMYLVFDHVGVERGVYHHECALKVMACQTG